ncbi:hypothetical protein I4U23_029918 [Adineta vaga]|nr:hypothetical protein I4U23_029918 [Adineta vaga]
MQHQRTTITTNSLEDLSQSFRQSRITMEGRTVSKNRAKSADYSRMKTEDEQQGMNILNNRFANYLDKIKNLADININLRTEIENIHETYMKNDSNHLVSQTEFTDLRRQLNNQLRQYVVTQIRLQRADYDRRFYRNKLQIFSSTEKFQSLQQKLESDTYELSFLKEQYEKQQMDFQLNKKLYYEYLTKLNSYTHDYTTIIYERMKIENYLYTLKEKILFEQEYNQRCQQEFDLLEKIQHDSNNFFTKTELENTLQKIRNDYKKYNQSQLIELETLYQMKFESFQQDFHSDEKVNTSKEIIELAQHNQSLQKQLKQLENNLNQLLEQNQQENEVLNDEYQRLELQMSELQSHILYSRTNTIHLSSEINTYRCLLINLIPSSHKKLVKISSIERITGFTVYHVQGMVWVRI